MWSYREGSWMKRRTRETEDGLRLENVTAQTPQDLLDCPLSSVLCGWATVPLNDNTRIHVHCQVLYRCARSCLWESATQRENRVFVSPLSCGPTTRTPWQHEPVPTVFTCSFLNFVAGMYSLMLVLEVKTNNNQIITIINDVDEDSQSSRSGSSSKSSKSSKKTKGNWTWIFLKEDVLPLIQEATVA